LLGTIKELSDNAVRLVNQDADANDILKANYKKESDKALANLGRMADVSEQRISQIIDNGGLTDAAVARISRTQQGVADLKRKTQALEAARGKGGAASRISATELEGLKTLGEVTAGLEESSDAALAQAMGQSAGISAQQANIAGQQAQMLEETRGRDTLAAQQPYDQLRFATEDRKLAALNNANVETRRLTGAEGEASLARDEQYRRDRQSLITQRGAAEQTSSGRIDQMEFDTITGQNSVSRSMADIMGVQAQNYANMAQQADARTRGMFSTAIAGTIGGVGAGGGFGSSDARAQFGRGFMQSAFGRDMGVDFSNVKKKFPLFNQPDQTGAV